MEAALEITGVNSVYRPVAVQDIGRNPLPDSAANDLAKTAIVPKSEAASASSDDGEGGSELERRVIIDPDTQEIVFQSVDDVTQSVVRQYPDQAMLRRKAYYVKLDEQKSTETETAQLERRV